MQMVTILQAVSVLVVVEMEVEVEVEMEEALPREVA